MFYLVIISIGGKIIPLLVTREKKKRGRVSVVPYYACIERQRIAAAICQSRRGACHSALYSAIVNEKKKEEGRSFSKRKTKKIWMYGDIISSIPRRKLPVARSWAPRRALRVLI